MIRYYYTEQLSCACKNWIFFFCFRLFTLITTPSRTCKKTFDFTLEKVF